MKVGEICIYFQYPIRLYKQYCSYIYERYSVGEKRFVLEPCDDIVQGPGNIEEDGTDGQPPVVDWSFEEYKEAMPDAKDKLSLWSATTGAFVEGREFTSIRISLCSSTPLLIFATVMQAMMMRDPTINPCAHASRIRPFVFVGFVTWGRSSRLARAAVPSTKSKVGLISGRKFGLISLTVFTVVATIGSRLKRWSFS